MQSNPDQKQKSSYNFADLKKRSRENSDKSPRMATLENVVMEEDEAGNNAKEEDELPDDVLRMSTDELISRTRPYSHYT